jgi:hypothetical protein
MRDCRCGAASTRYQYQTGQISKIRAQLDKAVGRSSSVWRFCSLNGSGFPK